MAILRVTNSTVVNRPRAELFQYLSRLETLPKWNPHIDSVRATETPPGVTARYETEGKSLVMKVRAVVVVKDVEPPARIRIVTAGGPLEIDAWWIFEEVDAASTRFTVDARVAKGGIAVMFAPLLRRLMDREMRRNLACLHALFAAG